MSPRVAVSVLGLAAVPIGGGPVHAVEPSPALRLVWFDPDNLASGGEIKARAEASDLLARMGAPVSWRRGAAGEAMTADETWVIVLGEAPPSASGAVVLGATRRMAGVSTPVWVRLPNVRAAAGFSPHGPLLGLHPIDLHLFCIALGRVIAHEVVHVLAPSLPHGRGLMSGNLTRRQLTAPSIPVDPEVTVALRAALEAGPGHVPDETVSVARILAAEPWARRVDR